MAHATTPEPTRLLTKAETEVLLHLIGGLTAKESAAIRGTSAGTVQFQRNALYQKLGVCGRKEAIAKIAAEGFGALIADDA